MLRRNHATSKIPSKIKKQYDRLKQDVDDDEEANGNDNFVIDDKKEDNQRIGSGVGGDKDEEDKGYGTEDENDDGSFGGVADIDVVEAIRRAQQAEKTRFASLSKFGQLKSILKNFWIKNANKDEMKCSTEQQRQWVIRIFTILINFSMVIGMLVWTGHHAHHGAVPVAPLGLKDLCAPVALELGDTSQCEKACHPASCCWSDDMDGSCLEVNEEICIGYSYCKNLLYHFEKAGIQPSWSKTIQLPSPSIHRSCALDDNGIFKTESECLSICQPSSCCFELSKKLNCVEGNEDACQEYAAFCSNLPREGFLADYDGSIPPAPNTLTFVCSVQSIQESNDNYDMCTTFCKPALCCIGLGNIANCADPEHEKQCEEYSPHCKHVWPDVTANRPEINSNYVKKFDVPSPIVALCSEEKRTWDANGNNFCLDACKFGECCWADGDENCENEYGSICAEYQNCPDYQNHVVDVDKDWFIPHPSTPIDELCSISSVLTAEGLAACSEACNKASCCFDTRKNNCANALFETCDLYHPCKYLPKENQRIAPVDVRPPVDNVCSEKNLRTARGRALCNAICEAGECCFDDPPYNCFDDNPGRCREYDGCRAMTKVPPAPSDLPMLCSDEVLQARGLDLLLCEDACKPGSCCNEPDPGNCFQQNGDTCNGYEPCMKINANDGFDVTPLAKVCSPDNFSVGDGGIECADECAVAKCCYSTEADNCFATHPFFCNAYMPYCTSALGAQALSVIQQSKIDEITQKEEYDEEKLENDDKYYGENEDDDEDYTEYQEFLDPTLSVCSKSNISTKDGRQQCEQECNLVDCCRSNRAPTCPEVNESYCNSHVEPCAILDDLSMSLLDVAPSQLNNICHADNIISMEGLDACEKACAPASCCFTRGGTNCAKRNSVACDSYAICEMMGNN